MALFRSGNSASSYHMDAIIGVQGHVIVIVLSCQRLTLAGVWC